MQIVKGIPPVYNDILKAGLKPTKNTVFTYGDKLYIQEQREDSIDPILLSHEEVHAKQQGDNPLEWWKKYLKDPIFRFQEELEAYATQYKKVKEIFPSKYQKIVLFKLAQDLSSPMYGGIITTLEAESKIRNKAKTI